MFSGDENVPTTSKRITGNIEDPAATDQPNEGNDPDQVGQEQHTPHVHKRTGVPLTRKRKRNPDSWKKNIRKSKRQSGEKYINSRGNEQAARSVKTKKDCTKCKFRCSSNISDEDGSVIFKEFWAMSDNKKLHLW